MIIEEGRARISSDEFVFYNPKMKELRDISSLYVRVKAKKGMKLLDSTSASGIRGIRYYLETDKTVEPFFLDVNEHAYKNTLKNLKLCKIKAQVENLGIREFCNTFKGKFDIIDFDPFGSASPELFNLMRILNDDGIIMVTATDTAVLCGAHSNACIKSYSSVPLHNELCKEAGLRILIAYAARCAALFNIGIKPEVSISKMHYMRTFIQTKYGAEAAVSSLKQIGNGAFCSSCKRVYYEKGMASCTRKECDKCNKELVRFGPVWLGDISDKSVIKEMVGISADEKISQFLTLLMEELETPFFYSLPKLTRNLHLSSVSMKNVLALLKAEGDASATQFDSSGIKTALPVESVVRAVKQAVGST